MCNVPFCLRLRCAMIAELNCRRTSKDQAAGKAFDKLIRCGLLEEVRAAGPTRDLGGPLTEPGTSHFQRPG
jgi:hypothetical protein